MRRHRPLTEADYIVAGIVLIAYWPEIKWTLYHGYKLGIMLFKAMTFMDINGAINGKTVQPLQTRKAGNG